MPRDFRFISIYIFDRDKHLKQNKVLGKVAIKREELASYNNKDHWFVYSNYIFVNNEYFIGLP